MADVGEIWHRVRHDRAFREQLERDPASVLSGTDLNDDELALLDAALRASHPTSASDLFSPRSELDDAPGTGSAPPPPHPGGDLPPDQRMHP